MRSNVFFTALMVVFALMVGATQVWADPVHLPFVIGEGPTVAPPETATQTPTPTATATSTPEPIVNPMELQLGFVEGSLYYLSIPNIVTVTLPFSVSVTNGEGTVREVQLQWIISPCNCAPRAEARLEASNSIQIGPLQTDLPLVSLISEWVVGEKSFYKGAVPTPSPMPTSTPQTPEPILYFGFEEDMNGWATSEGEYKLAELSLTTIPVYSGASALALTTVLSGTGEEVLGHTETVGYFHDIGEQDLANQPVSMQVFFPVQGFSNGGNLEAILFVKDSSYRNQFAKRVVIQDGGWVKFDLFVNEENDGTIDSGFDPTKIFAVGLRLEAKGNYYFQGNVAVIDDVRMGVK